MQVINVKIIPKTGENMDAGCFGYNDPDYWMKIEGDKLSFKEAFVGYFKPFGWSDDQLESIALECEDQWFNLSTKQEADEQGLGFEDALLTTVLQLEA